MIAQLGYMVEFDFFLPTRPTNLKVVLRVGCSIDPPSRNPRNKFVVEMGELYPGVLSSSRSLKEESSTTGRLCWRWLIMFSKEAEVLIIDFSFSLSPFFLPSLSFFPFFKSLASLPVFKKFATSWTTHFASSIPLPWRTKNCFGITSQIDFWYVRKKTGVYSFWFQKVHRRILKSPAGCKHHGRATTYVSYLGVSEYTMNQPMLLIVPSRNFVSIST